MSLPNHAVSFRDTRLEFRSSVANFMPARAIAVRPGNPAERIVNGRRGKRRWSGGPARAVRAGKIHAIVPLRHMLKYTC